MVYDHTESYRISSLYTFMPTIKQIWQCMQQGDYAFSVDLKDAYLHIPIQYASSSFLHFVWQNKPYQWKVLTFGLTSAHRIFSSLTKTYCVPLLLQGFKYYHIL